jgi:integrase
VSAPGALDGAPVEQARHRDWEHVVAHAPLLAVTAWAYVDQLALSMRPATVDVADNTLRCFAGFLVTTHPEIVGFVDVRRCHVEGFKLFFAAHLTVKGSPPARNTIRQRLGMLRSFFDRIIEWDWPDAPARMPIFAVDVPVADDPLPRFLDDAQAARFATAAAIAVPFDRLVIELLSRTGMRVGELCTLAADAVVVLNGTPWLRIPVGKLHNDRYVPLHPNAARLLTDWTATNPPLAGRLLHRDGAHIDRHQISRIVRNVGRAAGLGHVHPHQLRHTLATQANLSGVATDASFGIGREGDWAGGLEIRAVA